MLRALRTALLAGYAVPELSPGLGEWGYGRYEGLTTAEIRRRIPTWSVLRCGAPGGESPEAVSARCDELLREWDEKSHRRVLCFAHGDILRALATRCSGWGWGCVLGSICTWTRAAFPAWVEGTKSPPCTRWNHRTGSGPCKRNAGGTTRERPTPGHTRALGGCFPPDTLPVPCFGITRHPIRSFAASAQPH